MALCRAAPPFASCRERSREHRAPSQLPSLSSFCCRRGTRVDRGLVDFHDSKAGEGSGSDVVLSVVDVVLPVVDAATPIWFDLHDIVKKLGNTIIKLVKDLVLD